MGKALMSPAASKDPKEKIIFALDVEHFSEAQRWVNLLKDHIGMFKVGTASSHMLA
jgi:orotidine-5'-phosphate decarboxylase